MEIDYHYYSVPYQHTGERIDVRLTATTVENFLRGRRIASHLRSYFRGRHTTDPGHRPESHRRHLEWPPERLVSWAETTGPETAALVKGIMEARPHPEHGYRSGAQPSRSFQCPRSCPSPASDVKPIKLVLGEGNA